jgi:alkylated DNA repair dioxygenase AlkB
MLKEAVYLSKMKTIKSPLNDKDSAKVELFQDTDFVFDDPNFKNSMMLYRRECLSASSTHPDFKVTQEDFQELENIMIQTPVQIDPRFGKAIVRKQCAWGNEYRFAGQVSKQQQEGEDEGKWPRCVRAALAHARSLCSEDIELNTVHVNYYTGNASMGLHTDDEKEMIHGSPIFSYTLLCAKNKGRVFRIRQFTRGAPGQVVCDLQPRNGDLIVMAGDFQKDFKHEVPKTTSKEFEGSKRINLTVRAFKKKV